MCRTNLRPTSEREAMASAEREQSERTPMSLARDGSGDGASASVTNFIET